MSSVAAHHVASKVLASADRKRLALPFILAGGRIPLLPGDGGAERS